ncbi:urokinase plasminogen activator surface receptor-like [Pimephales promelas]|nr:urokinase plasminogen activator surface receptor-like [Pimephales promelas]
MDLQISVFLLFILFTAGHSLNCNVCLLGSCAQKTCSSGENCLSLLYAGPNDISSATTKLCFPASNCTTGSLNIGSFKFSSYCCNTDLCNSQDASDPSNPPNGNKCYYCDGQNCSKVLSCSGSQDRCIKATGTFGGQTLVVKGCVSKSICDATTSVSNVQGISCCEGNLCNGSQSVTQSVLILCGSLLSYFLMH